MTKVVNENKNKESSAAIQFNNKPIKQRLKIILSNHHYKRVLPFIILWVIAGYMPAVFFTPWAAQKFSGCTAHTLVDQHQNSCQIDYNSYNKTNSIFSSLGGLMAFVFGGLIGRISDSFGRLPFFYMNIILSASLYAPLIFFPNIWVTFIMKITAGLNSSDNSFTPMMMAYMSDVFPDYQRTFAYSVAYGCCAIGLLIGVFLAIFLGMYIGDEANFVMITILNGLQLIYCYFLVPESLKNHDRKPFTINNLNPLRPLYHCYYHHSIVLWVSLVQFIISLPETGILDMSIIYVLDQLNIQNETDANITNAIFIISCSVGLVLGPLVLLPKLQEHQYSNIQILCVGTILFFMSFILFSFLPWIKSIIIPIICGVLITSGFISFPAANGIVTKYLTKNEQGIGFGVIFAVRSITWIIAPILFAEMYSYFKENGVPSRTMYMAAFMILIAIIIIVIPLRRTINETEKSGKIYSFSNADINVMNANNDNEIGLEEIKPLLLT